MPKSNFGVFNHSYYIKTIVLLLFYGETNKEYLFCKLDMVEMNS